MVCVWRARLLDGRQRCCRRRRCSFFPDAALGQCTDCRPSLVVSSVQDAYFVSGQAVRVFGIAIALLIVLVRVCGWWCS